MKLTLRLSLIVLVAMAGYAAISWYLPRRAAKQDLEGIESRLELIERDLAILVDRVGTGRPAEGGAEAMPAAYRRDSDERMDRLIQALESLARTLEQDVSADGR